MMRGGSQLPGLPLPAMSFNVCFFLSRLRVKNDAGQKAAARLPCCQASLSGHNISSHACLSVTAQGEERCGPEISCQASLPGLLPVSAGNSCVRLMKKPSASQGLPVKKKVLKVHV